jgi:TfoX/Sxy family transcriptional regulator of competence genes
MASSQSTVDFIAEQMSDAGTITTRKMFGEYALYVNGKVFALVCDDNLFIKPINEAKEFYPEFEEAPPYPGAKMYMLIDEGRWDDRDFMSKLASISNDALPMPKPKKKK